MRKVLYTGIGFIFLLLALVGVVVRGLPTTPLLLVASHFFLKGNERINKWFQGTKIYKKYLKDYIENRSMTKKRKIKILILATSMIVLSFILTPVMVVRILLVPALIFLYYYFFFRIKTVEETLS